MVVTLSERQFAKSIGVSHSAVQERRKAGRLPRSASQDARGRWRIDPAVAAEEWEELAPLRVVAQGADSLRAWREARARREAALAGLAEAELAKSRGELLEAAGVERRLVGIFSECKVKILGVPTRLKAQRPNLDHADLAAVEALLREALEALAEGGAHGHAA